MLRLLMRISPDPVFSATERERLHGHTHAVRVTITGPVAADGMIANYAVFKERVRVLCDSWDEMYLIPSLSPYVTVRHEGGRSSTPPCAIPASPTHPPTHPHPACRLPSPHPPRLPPPGGGLAPPAVTAGRAVIAGGVCAGST
jgi:hypothetical protein